jgi:hypothetical protein
MVSFDIRSFADVLGINVPDARLDCIKKVIEMMPHPNIAVLVELTRFLCLVVARCDENKMTSGNLAVVFAPNLLRHRDLSIESVMSDTQPAVQLMESLISHYDSLLGVSFIEDFLYST